MTWQDRYLARFYDRERGWRDGTERFFELCAAHLPRGGRILEVGSGPSNETSRFLSGIGEVHGLDPDPDVLHNDALTSATVARDERFPFDDDSFDGCVSNYVIEHVPDPSAHLREVRRVLRPGASYVFRCPNRYHYVAVVSSLTPHWFHVWVANRLRNMPAEAHDPYPTVYRMNTRRAVRRVARESGLEVARLGVVEAEPMYGLSSRALFLLFMLYERLVNSTTLLEDLRSNLFGVLRKPGTNGDQGARRTP